MARKKFEEGFKENAIEYCKTHSDKTIKACAAELGIGYSTLRRWIAQSEEQAVSANVDAPEDIEGVASEDAKAKEVPATEEVAEEVASTEKVNVIVENEPAVSEVVFEDAVTEGSGAMEEAKGELPVCDLYDDAPAVQVEAVQEDLDDEFDWVSKRDTVKSQLGEFIENAGNGVSDAVQLIALYKKRRELKKVQKKLQKKKKSA